MHGLWESMHASQRLNVTRPNGLLPLPASKAAVERRQAAERLSRGDTALDLAAESPFSDGASDWRLPLPGEAVVERTLVRDLLSVFQSLAEGRQSSFRWSSLLE